MMGLSIIPPRKSLGKNANSTNSRLTLYLPDSFEVRKPSMYFLYSGKIEPVLGKGWRRM